MTDRTVTATRFAKGLGYFSLALGMLELAAPRALSRWLGMPQLSPIIRGYGLREIGTGIAILGTPDPAPFVWARVAGDVLDAATLAPGLNPRNPKRRNVWVAAAAVAAATAADLACALLLRERSRYRRQLIGDARFIPSDPSSLALAR